LCIENFFTEVECDETKLVTMEDAFQVTSATFSPLAQSKRTSTSWFCYYDSMPVLLAKAHGRLGIPLKQMEEPQIVRYRSGEEFSWHYDEVPPTQLNNGGQRVATLLVYLNTVKRGGGTIFRDLKNANGEPLTVKPVQGSALLFFPAFANGRPDDRYATCMPCLSCCVF
jgi:prolyl 4-hydroxylase